VGEAERQHGQSQHIQEGEDPKKKNNPAGGKKGFLSSQFNKIIHFQDPLSPSVFIVVGGLQRDLTTESSLF
jgi:hypothetical protein